MRTACYAPLSNSVPEPAARSDSPDLVGAVDQLHEEVRILRQAIDELRDDVVWAARQVLAAGHQVSPSQAPRRPVDPLAPDAGDVSDESAEAADESLEYCCVRPQLSWHGDPESPGIACENCGYLVAEQGSVLIWRADEPGSDSEPTSADTQKIDPQAQLFD